MPTSVLVTVAPITDPSETSLVLRKIRFAPFDSLRQGARIPPGLCDGGVDESTEEDELPVVD